MTEVLIVWMLIVGGLVATIVMQVAYSVPTSLFSIVVGAYVACGIVAWSGTETSVRLHKESV